MHFANISSFHPTYHEGSQWNLHQRHSISSILGFDRHDLELIEISEDNPRYEREIDLVKQKTGAVVEHVCTNGQCKRIYINVSGQMFETQLGTLNRFPNTMLGNPAKRRLFWDVNRRCYFLNQHVPTFQCVLYYYQSGGRLYRPEDIPEEVFLDELNFYELGADVLQEFKHRNGFLPEGDTVLPSIQWQRKLWLLLEYPYSSTGAKILGLASLLVIILSISNFCMETVQHFDSLLCINVSNQNELGLLTWREEQNYKSPFFIIECVCSFWFTIELSLRFASCPNKKRFFCSLMNLFDFGSVIPFYIFTILVFVTRECDQAKQSGISIAVLRMLRLFRVFRIFKLSKHSRGMQILGLTIKQSLKELYLFGIFLGIAMIFFSAAIYFADMYDTGSENISSIPDAFWWAIITMCTVGYGDIVPKGLIGKLVGSICVVSGVVTIALLVPVVVSNFSNYYNHITPDVNQRKLAAQRLSMYAEPQFGHRGRGTRGSRISI